MKDKMLLQICIISFQPQGGTDCTEHSPDNREEMAEYSEYSPYNREEMAEYSADNREEMVAQNIVQTTEKKWQHRIQSRQQRRNGTTEYNADNREEMVTQNIGQTTEKKW